MKVTVSMITLNEERAVAKVIGDIRRIVPDAEIFLVDSSTDRTAEIAAELGCRVFKQFPPKGYGPAMDRAVRDARGEVVVTLDCDDTYPVEEIPHLVALVEQGADLVNATRLAKRPKAMPFANYLANRLFAQERSITADVPGTTRDWVGEIANIDGLAVLLLTGCQNPGPRFDPHAPAAAMAMQSVVVTNQINPEWLKPPTKTTRPKIGMAPRRFI